MAQKRMFSLKIIDTDLFLEMPASTQNLYFHLCMRADDDGFIDNPKKIMKMIGSNDDDLKILLAKEFIIKFETGIIVIKHWKIHNYIAKDRYNESLYKNEKNKLDIDENGMYTKCIQNDNKMITECIQNDDPDKIRLDKVSKDNINVKKDKNYDEDNLLFGVYDNYEDMANCIYNAYPSIDERNKRSTHKSKKDKDKIIKLVKGGLYPRDLLEMMMEYLENCNKSKCYLRDLSTFLNNLPEREENDEK